MALVDYTSSDEEPESVETIPSRENKRKQDFDLPPLPTKFHDLYASTARIGTRDDPSFHGGRKRATPHIEGNWPTHLYVEWYPTTTEHELLTSLIASLQDESNSEKRSTEKIQSFLTSDLGASLPLHISLSRPIGFPTDKKDAFVSSIQQKIIASGIRPFETSIIGLDWVPNFDQTRWFLVLRLGKPEKDGLNRLLRICNDSVQNYGQPPLYEESTSLESRGSEGTNKRLRKSVGKAEIDLSRAFHISIAWSLTAPDATTSEATGSITSGDLFTKVKAIRFKVEQVKSKVGNVVTSIYLPLKTSEEKGLLGT